MTGAAEARPQARTRRRADSLPSRAMMVAVWIASVSYVGSRITRDWTPHDEGLLAQSAERLLLYLGYYCIRLTFVVEVLSWIDKGGDCWVHVFWYCQTMPNYVS